MIDVASLPPGHPGTKTFLSEREWHDIREAIARGVTVEQIYPQVSHLYKNPKSFRSAIENRFGNCAHIRGAWKK